jgi:hypothetical protein
VGPDPSLLLSVFVALLWVFVALLGVFVAVGFVAACPWKFIRGGLNFPIERSALVTP